MQEAAFRYEDIDAFYLSFEFRRNFFREAMRNLRSLQLDGFNVTVPYKVEILRYVDHLLPSARLVGAANTVFRRGRRWVAANTDVEGFRTALERVGRFRAAGKRVLVFGAGGAAKAVLYALAEAGAASINVVNRHLRRAHQIIHNFQQHFPETAFHAFAHASKDWRGALCNADLIVNATSVGLSPKDSILIDARFVPRAGWNHRKLFFDLIYFPVWTSFLKTAYRKGHRVLGGLPMLLYQGARAFEYWTSRKAPLAIMKKALEEALEDRTGKKGKS